MGAPTLSKNVKGLWVTTMSKKVKGLWVTTMSKKVKGLWVREFKIYRLQLPKHCNTDKRNAETLQH